MELDLKLFSRKEFVMITVDVLLLFDYSCFLKVCHFNINKF